MHFKKVACGGAAVLVLGLGGCGKDPTSSGVPTPPPSTAAPATLADLAATLTSPEAGRTLNCREDVHAQITLTNRSASRVLLTGVVKASSVVSGGCTTGGEFHYTPAVAQVFTNSTTIVLDQALYNNGTGCCTAGSSCSGGTCEFQETFRVGTEVGEVPAGSIRYKVTFSGCVICSTTVSAVASLTEGRCFNSR
jgi:hypothetical protein